MKNYNRKRITREMTIKKSDLFHLDDRSREIFKRIVEEYLAKGFPIGSRTV